MHNTTAMLDAYLEMVEIRAVAGFEPYMLTLMFKPMKGSARAQMTGMNIIAEKVYARILTRLVKRPKNTNLNEMPFWLSGHDWPVRKLDGWTVQDSAINDGLHLHAMVLVPPNARTGGKLSAIIEESPQAFLAGPGMPLNRLHVIEIEKTVRQAAGYALKSVKRGRLGAEDILVLPRHQSEISR